MKALLVALAIAGPAHALSSAGIDALWNYDEPAASERRFRAERARWPDGSAEALEIDTQVARAVGLQGKLDASRALLDVVAREQPAAPARVQVRYLLERGRNLNASGDQAGAVPLFAEAVRRAGTDAAPDAEFYRIDALHMLGIAAPRGERVAWNRRALEAVDVATTPRGRGWRASILNNLGWSLMDTGDAAGALTAWRLALAARETGSNVESIRIARWTVARGLRATGELDEAERMQRALAVEFEAAGKPDPHVFDELAEIAGARGDAAAAATWTSRAKAAR